MISRDIEDLLQTFKAMKVVMVGYYGDFFLGRHFAGMRNTRLQGREARPKYSRPYPERNYLIQRVNSSA